MTTTHAVANVSVEWLLKNLSDSIDMGKSCPNCCKDGIWQKCEPGCTAELTFDFARLLRWKVGFDIADPNADLGSYVHLAESILRDGVRKPLCIYFNAEGEFSQGNGHHRLALAILCAVEAVPVLFSFDGDYMHSDVTHDDDEPYWRVE